MAIINYANRVKETSTTTGTGSYTLDGAAAGFQSFSDGIGGGKDTHYVATDGTDWEVGIGSVSGSTTLIRATVLKSSNSDAAVNWGAGTKDIFVDVLASFFELVAANESPVQSVKNVVSSDTGLAVGEDHNVSNEAALAVGSGAASWLPGQLILAGGKFSAVGDGQSAITTYYATTTDATAAYLLAFGLSGGYLELESSVLPADSAGVHTALVIARDTDTGEAKAWELKWVETWLDAGTETTQLGSTVQTVLGASAGASAWDADVVSTAEGPRIEVTGEAAHTINWFAKVSTAMVGG